MIGESLNLDFLRKSEHPLAADIVNEFTLGIQSRSEWQSRINEVTQFLYATSTSETSNRENEHNHSTHKPKLTQIYDTLKANYESALLGRSRWFQFIGDNQEDLQNERRLTVESYLRTKHSQSNFEPEIKNCLDDWVRTGNCFAEVFYDVEQHTNPLSGAIQGGYKGPRVRRISPDDVVMNPLANDSVHATKIVRSRHTLAGLTRQVEDNPSMGYKKEILDKVVDLRHHLRNVSAEDIHKDLQLKFDGFGTMANYLKSGFVEVLDFYGDIYDLEENKLLKNHVITVVDRTWVIRNEPLNTYSGRPYIYHAGWRKRPDNLWAMGPLDNLVGLQYMVNHLTNARADAFDQMLLPDLVVKGDVEKIFKEDGSIEYRVPEAGDVRNLAPDTTVLQADLQIANIEQAMEEFAGVPKSAMGIKPPGEQTKFQVQTLKTAGDSLFQQKLEGFERDFVEPILDAELEVSISGLNVSDTISVLDDETGVRLIQDITPEDIHVSGNMTAVGARHFARQSKLVQELSQFQTVLAQDPEVRNHFPSSKIGKLYEQLLQFDEFDLYQENGRIAERADAAQLQQIAQQQVEGNMSVPADDLIEGDLSG
jgi:hypothetical protein